MSAPAKEMRWLLVVERWMLGLALTLLKTGLAEQQATKEAGIYASDSLRNATKRAKTMADKCHTRHHRA